MIKLPSLANTARKVLAQRENGKQVHAAESVLRHLETVRIEPLSLRIAGAEPVDVDVYELARGAGDAEILEELGERGWMEPWMLSYLMMMQGQGQRGPLHHEYGNFIFTIWGIPAKARYRWGKGWIVYEHEAYWTNDDGVLEPHIWAPGPIGPRVVALHPDSSTREQVRPELSEIKETLRLLGVA